MEHKDGNMSILMDCEDLNEWSLFGGQLELVNIDSGNQTMTDSWSESAPDSAEMASVDIDDIGIMSSLKVVSCPADDVGEFVDCEQMLLLILYIILFFLNVFHPGLAFLLLLSRGSNLIYYTVLFMSILKILNHLYTNSFFYWVSLNICPWSSSILLFNLYTTPLSTVISNPATNHHL